MRGLNMKPYKLLTVALALAVLFDGGAVASGAAAAPRFHNDSPQTEAGTKGSTQEVVGTLRSVKGSELTIQTQTGQIVKVDATTAIHGHRCAVLIVGRTVSARGETDQKGVLHADTILRAKDSSGVPSASK
jgi:hypothetical protein